MPRDARDPSRCYRDAFAVMKQERDALRAELRKIDSLLQDDLGGWYLSAPNHEPLGEVRDRIAAALKE